jgi:cyclopropane fatty-acyl-phospholipid synthase-like methyltransferase
MNSTISNNSTLNERIISYYDNTRLEYRVLWVNGRNRALHFGYYDSPSLSHSDALANMNKTMAEKIGISKDDIVLDAGCGQGGSALWLAEHIGAHVHGVTLVPHQVEKAKDEAKYRKLDHLTDFQTSDYCNTPYPDGSFSVIWACESVCHCPNKQSFYKEAFRLLKPGGRLIMAEYIRKERNMPMLGEQLLLSWCDGWSMPDLDTTEEHSNNLKSEGFINSEIKDVTSYTRRSLERLYKISKFLKRLGVVLHVLGIRNLVKHENHLASIRQYEALRQGLWYYSFISAQKPI